MNNETSIMQGKYYRAYAEIDTQALRRNIETTIRLIPKGTGIIAVIKTNAYGHGAVCTARVIDSMVEGYAVATVDEAVELRNAGIEKHILILGYVSPHEYDTVIQNNIITAVYSTEQAEALAEHAGAMGRKALCHIKVDTGMNRIGFDAKRPEDIVRTADCIEKIVGMPMLNCDGIFMHFATADETDKSKAMKQYDNFKELLDELSSRGINFRHRHCSNSAAIIDMPQVSFDWVRQGITLYGLKPSDEINQETGLYPVMSLKSHVVHIKTIHAGDAVSYGGTYVAEEDRRIATVSIGYGDGYPRLLSNKGSVLIHGKRAPIIGRICMDQFMVDITDIDDVRIEDTVTLLGTDGRETITAEEIGRLCGRFNYEFVCDINPRVTRIYI